MNTTFLPVGMGFVIGTLIPIDVGRAECAATSACASCRPAEDLAAAALAVPTVLAESAEVLLLLLQPVAITAVTDSKDSAVARRRTLDLDLDLFSKWSLSPQDGC